MKNTTNNDATAGEHYNAMIDGLRNQLVSIQAMLKTLPQVADRRTNWGDAETVESLAVEAANLANRIRSYADASRKPTFLG